MADTHILFRFKEKSPLFQLIVSLGIITGVGIFLFSVLLLTGTYIFDADLTLVENPSSAMGDNDLAFLRYIVIIQDISIFIVPAIIILILLNPVGSYLLSMGKMPNAKEIVFVIILTVCLFPVNSFTGQLNSMMQLPDWLSGMEQWMIEKEDDIGDLVNLLIGSRTFGVMMLNLLIIAIIPAIGEELLFRGVFQKIGYRLFRSGHLAVWVTAFFFSFIHFQFYGFIPRFILGLIFGYLFLWSRALWLPIISHFINNSVPVVGAYVQDWDKLSTQSDIDLGRQLIFLPFPVLIGLVILFYFRNKYKEETDAND
jgi:membrane protease YdiL (CAAX protease family)